eukprot:jgi/Picsp_1/5951/NSC_03308-R1_chromosome 9 open reading frame 114
MGSKKESSKKRKNEKNDQSSHSHLRKTKSISIAIGASCIENAQGHELGTLLAGQVARACAIFNVAEIIVLDDGPKRDDCQISKASSLFARVLQFMETPQYLRKLLIPMHEDLKYAGMLPPLDAPHHLRSNEWCKYREGVIIESHAGLNQSVVDIGLEKNAKVNGQLIRGARVTICLEEQAPSQSDGKYYQGTITSPLEPSKDLGLYWGYTTRIARNLEELFNQSPFQGGYDLTIGTSERGEQVSSCDLTVNEYQHALVVLGGPQGLEYCLGNDDLRKEHSEPSTLFHMYINVCSNQGSRTIRTEEALLITLTFLHPALSK